MLKKNGNKKQLMRNPENTDVMIKVVKISKHINPAMKIVSLEFPDGIQPIIGMRLIDGSGMKWHISGVVFDVSRGRHIYDCQIEGQSNFLNTGLTLLIE